MSQVRNHGRRNNLELISPKVRLIRNIIRMRESKNSKRDHLHKDEVECEMNNWFPIMFFKEK